ncbi:MAG: TIGR00730 family Rossman fold protein [Candidatus Omnitrophica bacterium]|nr:TIGR00730 family Rossman fold protein [Candidatus Omnitrophota bacterium]
MFKTGPSSEGKLKRVKPKDIKPTYVLKNEAANRAIQELLAKAGPSDNDDLLAQMITTVLKLQDEKVDRGDLKILNTTLKELRWAFRVFRPYRPIRKVSIFGSARTGKQDPNYRVAKQFGDFMAKSGWMVVTGGSSGIMQAGNEGAGPAQSFGANIRLPFEQAANPVIANDRKLINFKYFFTRKLIFVKESDAICLFPGGFGTLDEGFEVLTLIQTGKMMPRPIVMVDTRRGAYWSSWLAFMKRAILKSKMINPEDMSLFQMVQSPREAHDVITRFYKHYHSMRFVGDLLVIRLEKMLQARDLQKINRSFKDIILKGKIEPSGALSQELSETDLIRLPRLVFAFNHKSYGRLKQMIDAINLMGG